MKREFVIKIEDNTAAGGYVFVEADVNDVMTAAAHPRRDRVEVIIPKEDAEGFRDWLLGHVPLEDGIVTGENINTMFWHQPNSECEYIELENISEDHTDDDHPYSIKVAKSELIKLREWSDRMLGHYDDYVELNEDVEPEKTMRSIGSFETEGFAVRYPVDVDFLPGDDGSGYRSGYRLIGVGSSKDIGEIKLLFSESDLMALRGWVLGTVRSQDAVDLATEPFVSGESDMERRCCVCHALIAEDAEHFEKRHNPATIIYWCHEHMRMSPWWVEPKLNVWRGEKGKETEQLGPYIVACDRCDEPMFSSLDPPPAATLWICLSCHKKEMSTELKPNLERHCSVCQRIIDKNMRRLIDQPVDREQKLYCETCAPPELRDAMYDEGELEATIVKHTPYGPNQCKYCGCLLNAEDRLTDDGGDRVCKCCYTGLAAQAQIDRMNGAVANNTRIASTAQDARKKLRDRVSQVAEDYAHLSRRIASLETGKVLPREIGELHGRINSLELKWAGDDRERDVYGELVATSNEAEQEQDGSMRTWIVLIPAQKHATRPEWSCRLCQGSHSYREEYFSFFYAKPEDETSMALFPVCHHCAEACAGDGGFDIGAVEAVADGSFAVYRGELDRKSEKGSPAPPSPTPEERYFCEFRTMLPAEISWNCAVCRKPYSAANEAPRWEIVHRVGDEIRILSPICVECHGELTETQEDHSANVAYAVERREKSLGVSAEWSEWHGAEIETAAINADPEHDE